MRITIEAESISDFDTIIARFSKGVPAAAAAKEAAVDKVKPEPTAKAEAKVEPKPKDAAPKKEAASEVSYAQDIVPGMTKLIDAKGRDVAIALLAKFNVKKAVQLTADQYAPFLAALNEAISAED